MGKYLITVLVMGLFTEQIFGQAKDCWVFVPSSVTEEIVEDWAGENLVGHSVWFNAYAVLNCNDDLSGSSLPFIIDSLQCFSSTSYSSNSLTAQASFDSASDSLETDSTSIESGYAQINLLQGELFAKQGWTGEGVTIGVLDAGFLGLKEDSTLQHLFKKNRIKGTWDFVRRNGDVYRASKHGTQVMSCLAGLDHYNQFGLATDANYLLARAEQNYSAYLIREVRWIEALEWCVSNGAQIVTSSLIFSDQLFKRMEMNGQSLLSRAAEKAWSKGVLVLNSAGNSGDGYWEIIGAPSDAEHVLTVGACNYEGLKSDFSSIGPTSDYRMKPNVVALGDVFVSAGNVVEMVSGTSFACPMVAGFAACVLQGHPEKKPSDLWLEIQQSATLYPYYDYAHGYGIPQASYFIPSLQQDKAASEDSIKVEIKFHRLSDNLLEIEVIDKDFQVMLLDSADLIKDNVDSLLNVTLPPVEDSLATSEFIEEEDLNWNPYLLFVHVENEKGQLEEYWVVRLDGSSGGMYDVFAYPGHFMRVYYRSRIVTYLIE
jgi:subtilisin family serine protease